MLYHQGPAPAELRQASLMDILMSLTHALLSSDQQTQYQLAIDVHGLELTDLDALAANAKHPAVRA